MFALTIADDVTGAAEAAVALARAGGKPVRVMLTAEVAAGDVVVIPSRRCKPARARALVERLTLPSDGALFLKIDSTLRGPWVEMVEALAVRMSAEPLICSAFPARGRTVRDGVPLIDDAPLFASHFRREMIGAGEVVTLADLLRARAPELTARLPDAADDAALDAVAAEALAAGRRLIVGSAGLAEAFARVRRSRRGAARDPIAAAPPARGPVVVAAGSRAAATARQAARAADRAVILRAKGLRALAELAVEAVDHGTLVSCGGETSFQVLRRLGAHGMTVYGEAAPAVVWSRPIGADLTLLTKSGSLGGDDAIVAALEALGL